MYFATKNYLKSNRHHTAKHARFIRTCGTKSSDMKYLQYPQHQPYAKVYCYCSSCDLPWCPLFLKLELIHLCSLSTRRVSSLEAKLGIVVLPASFTSLNINSIVSRSAPRLLVIYLSLGFIGMALLWLSREQQGSQHGFLGLKPISPVSSPCSQLITKGQSISLQPSLCFSCHSRLSLEKTNFYGCAFIIIIIIKEVQTRDSGGEIKLLWRLNQNYHETS